MHTARPGAWTPKRFTAGVRAPTIEPVAVATRASSHAHLRSAEQRLLHQLMSQGGDEDIAALMQHAVILLAQLGGWRWAAAARFVEGGKFAQLLAFADRDRQLPGFTYPLAPTPCGEVVHSAGVHHIADLPDRFPQDHTLIAMGALHFAGLVYRRGPKVLGHVFVMHDQALTPSQRHQIDPLLQIAALHIGSRLELAGLQQRLREWQDKADTDEMTQLPNRRAFERELALQLELYQQGSRQDGLLAILDVNGLKRVNDARGHGAGDALLRSCAQALRSTLRAGQDQLFRLGGDEFAMLVDAPGELAESQLMRRCSDWQAALDQAGFAEAGLSIGLARLSEVGGERSRWLALADERMYQHKGARRRA